MKKTRVGILCGGKSGEHEVSLQSAKNIVEAIDREKYEVVVIGIDKKGQWFLLEPAGFLLHADDPKRISLNRSNEPLSLLPGGGREKLINTADFGLDGPIDVIFPILHGPYGVDGTVQGLLKLANIPFVGAGVLGSAVGMDKDVMKRLLREAGIPIGDFLVLHEHRKSAIRFEKIKERLGLPLFVKPANYGSSIGINKIRDQKEFERAVEEAFQFDRKILVEEFLEGREIECSVLGNDEPLASLPGEIVPRNGFYSYDAKYIDENGAHLQIPANLDSGVIAQIQALAIKAFKVLCCEGMARMDMFLKKNDEIVVNEINTIPGFTKISMYPKLWAESGVPYGDLIDRLIQFALERHRNHGDLK